MPDIPTMLANVKWQATDVVPQTDDLPYATHSGVFEIMGHKLRCYRLNTGQAIFDADDFQEFIADGLVAGT
jgi:hypothetical protein